MVQLNRIPNKFTCSLHIHPEPVLPLSWCHSGVRLHISHRHVQPRLYPRRVLHRLPALSWWERKGAVGLYNGNPGTSAAISIDQGFKAKTLLWWAPPPSPPPPPLSPPQTAHGSKKYTSILSSSCFRQAESDRLDEQQRQEENTRLHSSQWYHQNHRQKLHRLHSEVSDVCNYPNIKWRMVRGS